MTTNSAGAPVIAGLAAGIAFVVLFVMIFVSRVQSDHDDDILVITIPRGASDPNSGNFFVPQHIRVVIGLSDSCCSTVRWVNRDIAPARIEADNESDPAFYNATKDFVYIEPGKSFEFTFTKAGEFGYHGRPWERGTVIVLQQHE